jgi:hypothetical protein
VSQSSLIVTAWEDTQAQTYNLVYIPKEVSGIQPVRALKSLANEQNGGVPQPFN